eukprot:760906-Hanusia_phi.AAC.1
MMILQGPSLPRDIWIVKYLFKQADNKNAAASQLLGAVPEGKVRAWAALGRRAERGVCGGGEIDRWMDGWMDR